MRWWLLAAGSWPARSSATSSRSAGRRSTARRRRSISASRTTPTGSALMQNLQTNPSAVGADRECAGRSTTRSRTSARQSVESFRKGISDPEGRDRRHRRRARGPGQPARHGDRAGVEGEGGGLRGRTRSPARLWREIGVVSRGEDQELRGADRARRRRRSRRSRRALANPGVSDTDKLRPPAGAAQLPDSTRPTNSQLLLLVASQVEMPKVTIHAARAPDHGAELAQHGRSSPPSSA